MRICFCLICWFYLLVGPVLAGQCNVFIYHRFGEERLPSTNVSVDDFQKHLEILKNSGYQVLPLGELVRLMRHGSELPEKCAALTVDDAFTSFKKSAFPLLRQFGFPVTLFVSTDMVGKNGYLDWDDLRELSKAGVEIGNHSASHGHLIDRQSGETTEHWAERVTNDIRQAQHLLEKELGRPPILFAYPYGEYDPQLLSLVKRIGFAGATAQQSGVVAQAGDLFTLPRFPMGGDYASPASFREKLLMRHLPVEVVLPASPVLSGENPPVLEVRFDGDGIDLQRLKCYVPGQPSPRLVPDVRRPGVYLVQAREPLRGRRSKYTLTAPGRNGWYWFSQLWINPEVKESY